MKLGIWGLALCALLVGCGKKKEGGGSGADGVSAGKSREAILHLNKLVKNAKVFFATNAAIVTTPGPLTPPTMACVDGKSSSHLPSEFPWDESPWKDLDFSVNEPHYYSYQYEGSGTALTVTAVGDLDCDSVQSTFTITASVVDGNLVANQIIENLPNE